MRLWVDLEARLNPVPWPAAKAVLTIEYNDLLHTLADTPTIPAHWPSAVEVMNRSILDHARENPELDVAGGCRPSSALCSGMTHN